MNSLRDNQNINYLLLFLIFIYPLLMMFQGINMIDSNFLLVSYENFFKNPEISQYLFTCWLTELLGALTNQLFGWMGLIGFRIAYLIIMYITLAIVYRLLKPYAPKTWLLFFIFLSMIFINIDRIYIIEYNNLTALFFFLATSLLYSGLLKNNILFILTSGFILGLNIFIRFPNLLGIGLILAIIYYGFAKGNSKKVILKQSMYLLLGYILAIVVTLFIMYLLGHYELYIEKLRSLLANANNPEHHHSGSKLLITTIESHVYALKIGFILLVALGILVWLSRFWNQTQAKVWISSVFFTVIFLLLLFKVAHYDTVGSFTIYGGLLGCFFIILLWMAFKLYKKNPELGTLTVMAYLILEMIPLGSDTGFRNSVFGLYLALPLILIYLFSMKEMSIFKINITNNEIYFLKIQVIVGILIYTLVLGHVYFAAFTDGNRLAMRYPINHHKLKGIYTTKERAEALNNLIINLKPYIRKYNAILAFEAMSIADYITGLKPFMDLSSPEMYTTFQFKKKLESNIKNGLPLFVRAKTITFRKEWPKKSKPLVTTSNHISDALNDKNKKRLLLEDFLNRNDYKIVYEDTNFEILIPPENDKKINND